MQTNTLSGKKQVAHFGKNGYLRQQKVFAIFGKTVDRTFGAVVIIANSERTGCVYMLYHLPEFGVYLLHSGYHTVLMLQLPSFVVSSTSACFRIFPSAYNVERHNAINDKMGSCCTLINIGWSHIHKAVRPLMCIIFTQMPYVFIVGLIITSVVDVRKHALFQLYKQTENRVTARYRT